MDISMHVGYIAALSVAAERLTNILVGLLPNQLAAKDGMAIEKQQKVHIAKVNSLALITGVITALVAYSMGVLPGTTIPIAVAYGVLAAAGSGFWNGITDYLGSMKNLKRAEATEKRLMIADQQRRITVSPDMIRVEQSGKVIAP